MTGIIVDKARKLDGSTGEIQGFALGGNATFTIKSKRTGDHYTYNVKKAKDRDAFYFVRVNGGDGWFYLGYIKDAYVPQIIRGLNGEHPSSPSVRGFNWFFSNIGRGLEQAEFWHAGRCCRCNRELTDPKSIELGIGPECAKKG